MFANYHTHTYLCHHAEGDPREYVETAIRAGMKILGFSDHVHYPFPTDHDSGFRMGAADTPFYVEMLQKLREEYRKDIQILIGFEVEYYPDLFAGLLEFLAPYEYDYFILGQHFLYNEYDFGLYSGNATDSEEILSHYVDQVNEAVDTGRFSYIAHPDLLNYHGPKEIYEKHMTRLCRHAKEKEMPLEINFLGLAQDRHYPREDFFAIAKSVGNDIVFGCDAHWPGLLFDETVLKKAESLAEKLDIRPIQTVKIRNPK